MKTKLLLIFCLFSYQAVAQNKVVSPNIESEFIENDAQNPCINQQEYKIIEQETLENCKKLGIDPNKLKNSRVSSVPLSFPVKAAAGLLDCAFYHIAAYVDQNAAVGVVQDYNCGTNTYDGHSGTDISTWPYNFVKMDNNLVQVVAAAAGTIVNRHDGEFDRNCAKNNLTANYIIIHHSDGSYALYWHMKKNSVTVKAVGQTVVAGEYLGVVGSSGSASGPHLHFEVWVGAAAATRIDPYGGACNTLNASWWAAQKPYKETGIMKATVNATDNILPGCPTTETPNESTLYQIPYQGLNLSPGFARFYVFLRDEITGLNADMSILNPDGTTFVAWSFSSSTTGQIRMLGWSKRLPIIPGIYTFKAIYNGTICSYQFKVYDCLTGDISLPQDDVNLSTITSGVQTFNTQNLVAMNKITNVATNIVYLAEKTITLLPDFKADNFATFTAKIGGCN